MNVENEGSLAIATDDGVDFGTAELDLTCGAFAVLAPFGTRRSPTNSRILVVEGRRITRKERVMLPYPPPI